MKFVFATLVSVLVLHNLNFVQCQLSKEGYLVNKSNITDTYRCLVQVTGTKEGTKEFSGEPWDNDQCDVLVLQLTDETDTFDNGSFTIRVKSSGVYLSELNKAIGLSSRQQEFTAYIHPDHGCYCSDPLERTGINSLVNESNHVHIRFHNDIGPRCLNDWYYYDVYYEDSYGDLTYDWPYYIVSECFTDWWFIEVISNATDTTESPATQAPEQFEGEEPESSSNDLAIGLPVGLILAAILCALVVVLVIYLIKRKKRNQRTESAPDVAVDGGTADAEV